MRRSMTMMNALLAAGAFSVVVQAQDKDAPLAVEELACSFCHVCDKPTAPYPCLRGCPRTSPKAIAREMRHKDAPDVVYLNELEALYLPVPFDHRGHAEMADMTDGCAVCHHYTPDGTQHPACKTCHETSPKREDMRKPSLKAAYHRQCLSCHRDWSGGTQCGACHPPKVGKVEGTPTAAGLLSKMHPPIPEPHTEIYEPTSKPRPGEKIIFRHKEHIDRFGLRCAECHREDSCSQCHQEGKVHQQRVRTHEEHHKPCTNCHDVDNKNACDHCHWKEGEAKPKPFDHADTGWPLGKQHMKLGCRTCHESVPFRKLNNDCNSCHGDWEPDSFDHAVTGQVLDENHEDISCADCHPERKFGIPPKCDQCHDADEGIVFPAKRPGPEIIPSHRGKEASSGD